MITHLDKELDELKQQLLTMASHAETAVKLAVESLVTRLLAENEKLREACRECLPLIEFYTKREVESPSNHQEFAREAEERLRRFRAAIEKASRP